MKAKLSLHIADKEFKVTCSPEEKQELIEAAQIVSTKMEEIKKHGKTVGSDRIAMMAALNLASDLLAQRAEVKDQASHNDQALGEMLQKLEGTISALQQLNH